MKTMKQRKLYIISAFLLLFVGIHFSCSKGEHSTSIKNADTSLCSDTCSYIKRVDTLGLLVLYPKFSSVNLVCDKEPSKYDTSVILFAEAAYTGQCQKSFDHFNIAGDHVSSGKRYKGYPCKRNTGAFIYYEGRWHFLYKNYSQMLDTVAVHGGAAFGQELIIYNGHKIPTTRKDSNKNQFRALCEHKNKLCIVESDKVLPFGEFRDKLMKLGISYAIYLDMGLGWNYAWYRDGNNIKELHKKKHNYCTNWITFYK